jgi:hypothetical protein
MVRISLNMLNQNILVAGRRTNKKKKKKQTSLCSDDVTEEGTA